MIFAEVIIDISHEKVDRPFTYRIPEELESEIAIGTAVTIPFGRGDTERTGYVIGIRNRCSYPVDKIKPILRITPGAMTAEASMVRMASFIHHRYGGTMIAALRVVMPAKNTVKPLEQKELHRLVGEEELRELIEVCTRKHQTAKVRLLEAFLEDDVLPWGPVREKLHISTATVSSLEKQGILRCEVKTSLRNPIGLTQEADQDRKPLSKEQEEIVQTVISKYQRQEPAQKYLIQGITGSGKTEVYLGITEQMIRMGKQVIVLIPEIALTYQTLMRFYRRFGDRVSVISSALSAGERYDQYQRAQNGEIDVMIGPRSAIFTPFERLGAIIIDEEHEPSYKSETTPRYHATELAEQLAKWHQAALILGSATPSLRSRYAAEQGDYTLLRLDKRLTGGTLPEVEIVDLREELRSGNRSIFSRQLQELMEDRLSKGEQGMLFLNRRGTAGFVSCRSCGYVVKCPHCDVSMTEHRGGRMVCHYCGYSRPKYDKCPSCGSGFIMGFKAGTEAVEQAILKMFPKARVIRMDADTTRQKGDYEKLLGRFADGEADFLVGTQMIVKGHDFPNVTLMGVLAADLSLNGSDYRSGERTFQLITQAVGRAGRGILPGKALIQTYQPEHYAILRAADQDYDGFYEEEILYRRLGSYPPAGHMLAVLTLGSTEEKSRKLADTLSGFAKGEKVIVMGPAPAGIGKIQDRYRTVFYLKSMDTEVLSALRIRMEQYMEEHVGPEIVQYDLDPMGGF